VLLDGCESAGGEGLLRFWEPQEYFVVVGYGNAVAAEVNVEACRELGVPILRRCSGGGTVLQGPGCLNYALVLEIGDSGPLRTIAAANRFIMERNRGVLDAVLQRRSGTERPQAGITVQGHTDLAIGGRKFSGNAQRRRKTFLLFHGTFLLRFDLERVACLLPMPTRQPAYRKNRLHGDFLTNLGMSAGDVKEALREAWQAAASANAVPRETISALARDKYVTTEWIHRF